jgi:hypothetical protein
MRSALLTAASHVLRISRDSEAPPSVRRRAPTIRTPMPAAVVRMCIVERSAREASTAGLKREREVSEVCSLFYNGGVFVTPEPAVAKQKNRCCSRSAAIDRCMHPSCMHPCVHTGLRWTSPSPGPYHLPRPGRDLAIGFRTLTTTGRVGGGAPNRPDPPRARPPAPSPTARHSHAAPPPLTPRTRHPAAARLPRPPRRPPGPGPVKG